MRPLTCTIIIRGCLPSQAKEVSDKMFASAAQRLADYVTPESFDEGKIYPDLSDLRDISLKVTMVADACTSSTVASRGDVHSSAKAG